MRIDAHIHFTPPSMAEDLEAFAELEPYWGLLITPDPVNHTVQGWATPERMIADMDRAEMDKVVLLGVYRQTAENTRQTNDDTLALIRRWPERVLGFAVIKPNPPEAAVDELKRCLDGGMSGVGELNPYGQGVSFEDPGFLALMEKCAEWGVPVNLHVSEEIGHFYLGKSTLPLREYYNLACRFPELKIILAHWGGGLFFYELMPEVRQNLKNVWYDTAATPLLYPTEAIFRFALEHIGPKKILYGSDYPLLILPKQQTEPDFCPFLSQIDSLGLSADVMDDIMGANTARLLGLAPPEPEAAPARIYKTAEAPVGIVTEVASPAAPLQENMTVALVSRVWPATQAVFDRHGIPWQDSTVPYWEPVAQAAAARGLGPSARRRLLAELNEAIGVSPQEKPA